ncbi:hypothetical protein OG241_34035 [Streptomyces sp. NBC_01390]|uniref:hypothetical protein n=1 Tax=Streptomyces sp. NBC_01390 TaxID=2903850 RepID=UPI00325533E8
MATNERNNADPHAAAETLRAAPSDVELGRVRSDVAARLAEAIRRGATRDA